MQVAVVTLFNGLDSSYSLVNVVRDQVSMLLNHDIGVKLLVTEQCDLTHLEGVFADPRITWCPVVNTLNNKPIVWHDYSISTSSIHASFSQELTVITTSLLSYLEDVDVCILHDILYQGWHYIHNIAIRQVARLVSHLRFIAFTHSFPLARPLEPAPHLLGFYTPLRDTFYVYPTASGISALAAQYGVPEGKCKVISNTFNPLEFTTKEVLALHHQVNLYDTDLLIVYPARLTPAKQHECLIHLVGHIFKGCQYTTKVIFCDFPCSDIDPHAYKNHLRDVASSYNLPQKHIIFTTDEGFPHGFPRASVLDLMTLSNLFICPSYSESFGLTVLEAASRGNFIVLNKCVPALDELSEHIPAYLMSWPAKIFEGEVHPNFTPSLDDYYQKHAKRIMNQFIQNATLQAKTIVRRRYNPEWIWKNQLAPLLYID